MPKENLKREYIFLKESSLEHYEGDFIVSCVDDRFAEVRQSFLDSLDIKHKDPKTPAGGAKVFSSPFEVSDTEHYLRELAISIRLHHSKKAMLFAHHDCGAYGGFVNFENNPDKEFLFHCSEHEKAAKIIKERFPDLEVEGYFIDEKGIAKTL